MTESARNPPTISPARALAAMQRFECDKDQPGLQPLLRAYTRAMRSRSLDRSTIQPYDDGEPGPFYYARYDHPTGVEAERALGELEGGNALLFASGAAASAAAALGLLESGQTVALADGCYYGTPLLLRELSRWSLRVVEFDQ